MSSTGEAPFCWGPEVTGGGGGALEGGEGDSPGHFWASNGRIPHNIQSEVLGGK